MRQVILFTTPTCVVCKQLKPQLEKLCDEFHYTLLVLNALEHLDLAGKYNMMIAPTIVVNEQVFYPPISLKTIREKLIKE